MKKSLLFSILILMVFATVLPLSAEEKENEESVIQEEINKNERLLEKLRIVFQTTIKDKKVVFIRLTPGQFATTKVREKIRRDKGLIRVVLHPRQLNLLKNILEEEKPGARVPKIIRLSARIQDKKKGLKALYVVRPLNVLLREKGEDIIEEKPHLVEE